MKAITKEKSVDKAYVNGVELDFNFLNERHLEKWQQVGSDVEKRHPNVLDVSVLMNEVQKSDGPVEKYKEATVAICEVFDGVFGKGTSKTIFGDAPYYELCITAYYDFLGEGERQGNAFGQRINATIAKYKPAGPKGSKK